MLCQICHKRPAEIKISQAINDKKLQMELCSTCAEEKGFSNPLSNLPQLFGNFLSQLVGEETFKDKRTGFEKKCSGCGSSWENFHDKGLLGCEICYQTFEQDLNTILRRIHGSNKHIGSRPKSHRYHVDEAELQGMRDELQEAITSEKFERAAELRDKIRDVQREIDKRKDDGILR